MWNPESKTVMDSLIRDDLSYTPEKFRWLQRDVEFTLGLALADSKTWTFKLLFGFIIFFTFALACLARFYQMYFLIEL